MNKLGFFILVLGGFLVVSAFPPLPNVDVRADYPVTLQVTPSTVDLGAIPMGQNQSSSVILKNVGQVDLRLLGVDQTCSCLSGRLVKNHLKPQEEIELSVTARGGDVLGIGGGLFVIGYSPEAPGPRAEFHRTVAVTFHTVEDSK